MSNAAGGASAVICQDGLVVEMPTQICTGRMMSKMIQACLSSAGMACKWCGSKRTVLGLRLCSDVGGSSGNDRNTEKPCRLASRVMCYVSSMVCCMRTCRSSSSCWNAGMPRVGWKLFSPLTMESSRRTQCFSAAWLFRSEEYRTCTCPNM